MLRINNFQSLRGGDFADYTAPDLEVLRIDVEQGFQESMISYDWYDIWDPNLSWDEIDEEKFF